MSLHRPSAVVAGVSGISPNSSFELARDTVVAALAWVFWLSPEFDRFSDGGCRWEYIFMMVRWFACNEDSCSM